MAKEDSPISQKEIDEMDKMVRWFDPSVLVKVLKPVILSGIFGQYADRRLMQAALDETDPKELLAHADIRKFFKADDDGSIWFDYTADTGDGFSSTYAVASLLGRETLQLADTEARRGDLLVLGGDQVYPDASRETYYSRLRKPFQWAFPDYKDVPPEEHPLVYAIPGNHDWYDGLDLFLALFCKKNESWSIGNRRTRQRRSYFAVQLSDDWWLWGGDIQLSEYVDQPQAEYFSTIASEMPLNSKLIICTAVPGWLYGTSNEDRAYQSLGYFAAIARKANRNIHIPLVLSGDTHHYSRYVAEGGGTQFVTSGGGGAFLHPTHQLKDKISAIWQNKSVDLELVKEQPDEYDTAEIVSGNNEEVAESCYPSRETSKTLLNGNFLFAIHNWKFSAILGIVNVLLGLLVLMWPGAESAPTEPKLLNPLWLLVLGVFTAVYYRYADDAIWVFDGEDRGWIASPKSRKMILGFCHGLVHWALLLLWSYWLYDVLSEAFSLQFWSWSFNLAFFGAMMLASGLCSGIVFGLYLLITCRFLGVHANDAFSSMSLDSYKQFLRFRIKGDTLTMYPIGIDRVPAKGDWIPNPDYQTKGEAAVVSKSGIQFELIEKPVEIS